MKIISNAAFSLPTTNESFNAEYLEKREAITHRSHDSVAPNEKQMEDDRPDDSPTITEMKSCHEMFKNAFVIVAKSALVFVPASQNENRICRVNPFARSYQRRFSEGILHC
jgi:hypothetical protein